MSPGTERVAIVIAEHEGRADGVRDHAEQLATALGGNLACCVVSVDWRRTGLRKALKAVRADLELRRVRQVLLAYTHLSWSRRGFPFGFLLTLFTIRRGVRVTVWLHDPAEVGEGVRARFRNLLKGLSLRLVVRTGDVTISSVPATNLFWLGRRALARKVVHIPSAGPVRRRPRQPPTDLFTVTTFAIGAHQTSEEQRRLLDFALAVGAELGAFRLRILGDVGDLRPELWEPLTSRGLVVDYPGFLDVEELGARIAASHVFLSVRDRVTTRSSSTACALACGLPVIGFGGPETGGAILAAGVELSVERGGGDLAEIAIELARNPHRQIELSSRSHEAFDRYYAWSVVSQQLAAVLAVGDGSS